jgi:hypothetical protein
MRELVSAINTPNLSVQDAFAQVRSKVASASGGDQVTALLFIATDTKRSATTRTAAHYR